MSDCLFCKMAKGEIQPDIVYEDDQVIAFRDINPQAPVHVLVITMGSYVSWDDFSEKASADEMADFVKAIGETARKVGADPKGDRILANAGQRAGQEVPHLHVHIFGGQPLGRMIKPE